MGERMEEVEVVTKQEFCLECLTRLPKEVVGIPKPNSLTAARLRLADAAEAWQHEVDHGTSLEKELATFSEFFAAVAALRTARGA